ncbi:sigma-E factor negative regulatory protein [Hydrogenophaga sp.]|uniref:sigma-E factor negative regulatory protein n=1 Tax=Hydrogenophaga sp. TaxID=1904254 RepID=UPI00198384D1|nr:sigma-E factor negative regulatory protein [Hydrogenophaga sp.]MBD3893262.1 anti-anti-sigma factor [Hydrogenophaga sp.]
MNAVQTQNPLSARATGAGAGSDPAHAPTSAIDQAAEWSALLDGELTAHEVERLLAQDDFSQKGRASWNVYHVISDALRGAAPVVPRQTPQDFLAGFHARLQAPAADEPLLALAPALVRQPGEGAANDSIFRWKLLSGVASLTAVLAVSWSMLQGLSGAASGPAAGGPQLASVGALPEHGQRQLGVATDGTPVVVVVGSAQGPVLRDAQLEALLAQHRQHGGMSALQMPAGFLRNATYSVSLR